MSEFGSQRISFRQVEGTTNSLSTNFSGSLKNHLKVGDKLKADLSYLDKYYCESVLGECEPEPCYESKPIHRTSTSTAVLEVVDVQDKSITVMGLPAYSPDTNPGNCLYEGSILTVNTFIPREMNGGDLRVRQITLSDDQNNKYATRYLYNEATEAGHITSGVISQEPIFVGGYKHKFYDYFDYPATPVMYGKVTVLKGRLERDDDFTEKTEFYFTTPSSEMIQHISTNTYTGYQPYEPLNHKYTDINGIEWTVKKEVDYRGHENKLEINTSQIGQVKAVKRYNQKGMLESSTLYNYGSQLMNEKGIVGQGEFTEGTILAEAVLNSYSGHYNYKLNRTTKKYRPSVVTSIKTVTGGMETESTTQMWDFLTGDVLRKRYSNSMGQVYETQEVPAYHIAAYTSMGPKSADPANKNMLSQRAASYVYKITPEQERKLVAASVQTWKKDWDTYRSYQAASDDFVQASGAGQVWRKYAAYAWKTTAVNGDGTAASFTPYNFAVESSQEGWLKAGEQTHFNHFSYPLQSKDINGNHAATKIGYGQSQVIASASNAKYTEIAFSGAEDAESFGGTLLFGGEVRAGQGIVTNTYAHTGSYSLQLNGGSQGFVYKATADSKGSETAEVETSRKYRASVWVHNSDLNGDGKLFASLSDGTVLAEKTIKAADVKRAGSWRLVEIIFTVPSTASGKKLTVACKSTGSTVYVDDFRFQPLDAVMNANVYDTHTYKVSHILDNNNLYVRYEYDNTGRLIKTYRERLTEEGTQGSAEKLLSEASYFYARLGQPMWLSTDATMCEQDANGYTGTVLKELKDMNTSSLSYGQTKWIPGGYSSQCPVCYGPYEKWINGMCETGMKVYTSSVYRNGMYECSYYYTFSDNSQTETFTDLSAYPCEESELQ